MKIQDENPKIPASTIAHISERFKSLTQEAVTHLSSLKQQLDDYDRDVVDMKLRSAYLDEKKHEIFHLMDAHFKAVWDIVNGLPENEYKAHRSFYQQALDPYLVTSIQVGTHIRQWPLGYAGDFVMMNYIYDYNTEYLGSSTYEMLINNMICNIPVSQSNIKRKNYIKNQIDELCRSKEHAKIVSVGCGSARELIELLRSNSIKTPCTFICLDLEQKALDFIKQSLEEIPYDHDMIKIEYLHTDIMDLFKQNKLKSNVQNNDLIYLSGICDYLNDKLCKRIVRNLFSLLDDKGKIIVFNLSEYDSGHRAVYEFFGEWTMFHRYKSAVLNWVEDPMYEDTSKEIVFCGNYLALALQKQ